MRHAITYIALAAVAVGCSGEAIDEAAVASEFARQVEDLAGEYFYATADATCQTFYSDLAGTVYTEFFEGVCGSGSRVECVDWSCSLTCLQFNRSDTTALFTIADTDSTGQELYVIPYISDADKERALQDTTGEQRQRLIDRAFSAFSFVLYRRLVDCEYSIKAAASAASEE